MWDAKNKTVIGYWYLAVQLYLKWIFASLCAGCGKFDSQSSDFDTTIYDSTNIYMDLRIHKWQSHIWFWWSQFTLKNISFVIPEKLDSASDGRITPFRIFYLCKICLLFFSLYFALISWSPRSVKEYWKIITRLKYFYILNHSIIFLSSFILGNLEKIFS